MEPIAPRGSPAYPDARFAVISDLHYYDASLGTVGPAFEASRPLADALFWDSGALIELAIDEILKAGVQFVLIPGDLTKDGEAASHRRLPSLLARLPASGVAVYLIPGNHDMNNPRSFRYEGDRRILDASVTPEEFASLYAPFGYGQALLRHDGSLSYVAEPVPGLWLVAVDATLSRFNKPDTEEIVGARLSPALRGWLAGVLRQAGEKGKAVVYLQHHGIVEHWRGQARIHPDFLVEDFSGIGRMLAASGVRLAFTGHYHAQDITRGDFGDDGFLYDIETGSLPAPPGAVRICTLHGGRASLSTMSMTDRFRPGSGYREQATAFVRASVHRQAFKTLRKYKVRERDARYLSEHIAEGFLAHYRGDEDPAARPAFDRRRLGLWGRFVYSRQRFVLDGIWQDLPPGDNDVVLPLA